MSGIDGLRAAVTGLIGLAAAAEQVLLADTESAELPGSPQRWAAAPVIAHNTEFRRQQVQRLRAAMASGGGTRLMAPDRASR